MKNFEGTRIEYHILQSFSVTCLNRDDVGMPKTALVGGVERGRVSSQCWKRQVRLALKNSGIRLAIRTKRIVELIEAACQKEMTESKRKYIEKIAGVLSDDTLFFMSEAEAKALAEYIEEKTDYEAAAAEVGKKTAAELWKVMKPALSRGFKDLSALDIALFGRMVASAAEMDVEAACSFAHAITTHELSSSVDYFTAVDDFKTVADDAGAGHIGSSDFSSGTYYRYISLDLGLLASTLGEEADIKKAVEAFTKALYVAVPAARQTTMTGYCPWNYAHVLVRHGQGMQLSFEKPVRSNDGGYLESSIKVLDRELERYKTLSGSLWGEIADLVYGRDDLYSVDSLCSDLNKALDSLPEKEA